MNFDMNRTWSQGIALVQGNFQLLAVIAGVFLLIPGTLFYVAMPDLMTTITTSDDPAMIEAMLRDALGPLMIFGALAFIAQMVGYMAMIALMGSRRPTVGEALKRGFADLPSAIGVSLLIMLSFVLAGLVLSLVVGLIAGILVTVGGTGLATALGFLMVVAVLLLLLYLMTRFTLVLPVIVLEGERNPVRAIRRSWTLTRGNTRRIFVFFLLLFVCYMVLSLILGSVFGLAATALAGGTGLALTLGLFNGLIGAAVAVVFSGILVSMHQQLAGASSAEIKDTFE